MNLFRAFQTDIAAIIADLAKSGDLPENLDTTNITVEPPRDPSHGDISTNAAMVLAKPAGMKPRDIAALIAPGIEALDGVKTVDIAGPGFINAGLSDAFWHKQLVHVLEAGTDYGSSDLGENQKINVEYVSANPTGPLHVAHARGAVVGDALVNLLRKAGYDVTSEYYINDAGNQIELADLLGITQRALTIGRQPLIGRVDVRVVHLLDHLLSMPRLNSLRVTLIPSGKCPSVMAVRAVHTQRIGVVHHQAINVFGALD